MLLPRFIKCIAHMLLDFPSFMWQFTDPDPDSWPWRVNVLAVLASWTLRVVEFGSFAWFESKFDQAVGPALEFVCGLTLMVADAGYFARLKDRKNSDNWIMAADMLGDSAYMFSGLKIFPGGSIFRKVGVVGRDVCHIGYLVTVIGSAVTVAKED
jgi:hypothetical protein